MVVQKSIYFATCGTTGSQSNPGMTVQGIHEVKTLRNLLPAEPSNVVCGTGRRHRETAEALGLQCGYSVLVGTADSVQKKGDREMLVLADGTEIPFGPQNLDPDIWGELGRNLNTLFLRSFFQLIPHDTIFCGSRSFVRLVKQICRLSDIEVKPATVYLMIVDNCGHVDMRELKNSPPTG